jgi:hypothetical protein
MTLQNILLLMAQGCTLGQGYGALPGLVKIHHNIIMTFKNDKRTLHANPEGMT